MKYTLVHNFTMSPEEMEQIQKNLAKKVSLQDMVKKPKRVSGVDISYVKDSKVAICCIITMDVDTREILETVYHEDTVYNEYIPGFLSFRELPVFLKTWEKATVDTDIVFFDGNGVMHPRGLGLASHASFFIHKPTVGVAKTPAFAYNMPSADFGCTSHILLDGNLVGAAVRTRTNVKPVFVSVGNQVCLETAVNLVLSLSKADGKIMKEDSRIPCITRIPDMLSREYIRSMSTKTR